MSSRIKKHDVFISFRGVDTRRSFVSHLDAALRNSGLNVFMDDDALRRGNEISPSLMSAIESSRISTIVFSIHYAASTWCLEELEKIMEYQTEGMVVLPIFFDVQPLDVRHQSGTFGEKFQEFLNRRPQSVDKVRKWRKILTKAANLSGFDLRNRTEVDIIDHIVQDITMKLKNNLLFVAEHPVGVESRVSDIIKLVKGRSNDVVVLGLWGMGGIGKTTISKAIYNEIGHEFEHKCFLANIRKTWEKENGDVNLQEQLLSNILKTKGMKLQGVDFGKIKIKDILCHKRLLLVLDDVDEVDQLFTLCGRGQWLGPRSVLIITTRDEHLLKFSGVKDVHVHEMKALNESESLELFSWYAFKQKFPEDNFNEQSRNVVAYCCGLPLALEVLGSYLFCRDIPDWVSVLRKLQRIPNSQIKKVLKISYDGLSDDTEKEIFLHLSCFFIGKDRNYVIQILDDCGFHAQIGINVLKERSLITIDNENKLGMHDLLRDMGRDIIREQSPKEPGKRTRLWHHEEVLDVLTKDKGTKAIEGLSLSMPTNCRVCLNSEAFKKMKNLKFLQLSNVQFDGDYENLSRDLRWLCWHGFLLSYIPANFYLRSLVAIDLKYSNLKILWRKPQLLENLKTLNLSHSHYLSQTPDFSKLPNLEKLILKGCHSLSTVHHSIGDLNNILFVNLKDCTSLVNLPRSIYKLKCLKILILSGCSKIDKLEDDFEQMESLTILKSNNIAVTQVPFSIVRSKSIAYISMCGYEGFSVDVFPSLIWSWMSPMNYPKSLETFGNMSSLASVSLQGDSFHGLSSDINVLAKLRSLWVQCSPHNLLTQDVARILDAFHVTHCLELETTSNASQFADGKTSTLVDNHDQAHISTSEYSLNYLLIQMGVKVTDAVRERILQGPSILDDDNNRYWLTYKGDRSSMLFKVPQVYGFMLKGIILHTLYSSNCIVNMESDCLKLILIINLTKGIIQLHKKDAITSHEDEEWQDMISNLEPGDEVQVILLFEDRFIVKNMAIYLVYGELMKREGLTLEDKIGLHSIDENAKRLTTLKSKRSTCGDNNEGACFTRARKAKKVMTTIP